MDAAVERAAAACVQLDASPGIEDLEPVARLLLRAESIASSRIEGLRLSHRRIEHASRREVRRASPSRSFRNIEAMSRAIHLGTRPGSLTLDDVLSIHRTLMETEEDRSIARKLREGRTGSGWEHTPRHADFVRPRTSWFRS
ncbi:MAG: hypothetical protein U0V56_03540 [Actinomycetota bacterium]